MKRFLRKFVIYLGLVIGMGLMMRAVAHANPPPWTNNGLTGAPLSVEYFDEYAIQTFNPNLVPDPLGPQVPECSQHGNAGVSISQEPGSPVGYHSWQTWVRASGPNAAPSYTIGRWCGPQAVPEGAETTFYFRFSRFVGWATLTIGTDNASVVQPVVSLWFDSAGRVWVPQGPPWTTNNFHQVGTILPNQWYFAGLRSDPAHNVGRVGIYVGGAFVPVAEYTAPLTQWGTTSTVNASCLYVSPQWNSDQDIYLDWVKPGHLVH